MPPSKKDQKRGWSTCYEDTHALYYRRREEHNPLQYLFVEVTDMDDACGRDNAGRPRYSWDARLIDLSVLPPEEQAAAIRSCGSADVLQQLQDEKRMQEMLDVLAESCRSHGHGARLDAGDTHNFDHARAQGIRAAEAAVESEQSLKDVLDRPQNKIGTTGWDLLAGDLMAGLRRHAEAVVNGTAEPSTEMGIMMKMYSACKGQTLGGVTAESKHLSDLCTQALNRKEQNAQTATTDPGIGAGASADGGAANQPGADDEPGAGGGAGGVAGGGTPGQ